MSLFSIVLSCMALTPVVSAASENPTVYKYRFPTVVIEPGEFMMGKDATIHKRFIHKVRITKKYHLMQSEVTQALYRQVMGVNPSKYEDCDKCPVENVTWMQAMEFANKMSTDLGLQPCYAIKKNHFDKKEYTWPSGLKCNGWRLPTEAEWEFAAYGGDGHLYSGSANLDEVAWHKGNSNGVPHAVCTKKKNGYKLCDMTGNVQEWVWDKFGTYYTKTQTNPIGPPTLMGTRTFRGGSFSLPEKAQGVGLRKNSYGRVTNDTKGFRLARRYFPRVAVLGFGAPEAQAPNAKSFEAKLRAALDQALEGSAVTVVTSEAMIETLKADGKDSLCDKAKCEMILGQALGVDYVVSGVVTANGEKTTMNLKLVDVFGQNLVQEMALTGTKGGAFTAGVPGVASALNEALRKP